MGLTTRTGTPATAPPGTAITINKPSGVVAGDVLFAFIGGAGNGAATFSLAGWTQIVARQDESQGGAFGSFWVLYRNADGSEGASFAFAKSGGNEELVGVIIAVAGGGCYAGEADGVDTSGPAVTTPSITPTSAECLILSGLSCDQGGTAQSYTPTSASSGNTLTELVDTFETGNQVTLWVGSELQTTPAATAHTATYGGNGSSTRGGSNAIVVIAPIDGPQVFVRPAQAAHRAASW